MTTEVKSEKIEKGADKKIYLVRIIEEKTEIDEAWLTQNQTRLITLQSAVELDLLKMAAFEKDYYAKKTDVPK